MKDLNLIILNGMVTRYLLITEHASWNKHKCVGFSKITFNVTDCPNGNCNESIAQSQPPGHVLPTNNTNSILGTTSLSLSP